ncbi:hypothetical protein [Acetobacter oeni]|uniref:Uncharacterized protein n=1 Tax=Acetobacter oeni TaxID=304077 RepID=A0A511XKU8_9PROT|nr:hypothetical protein [Acetobacter oeni]MBB3883820.1 hypothetical protein [Acetobacter oeni]NHO19839.1 hypothetical protein [Acetobacter oeni]GBR10500.1 hypothetical protein AA21952_3094 [Acetobacter oeni LMG 21952]GEN63572.1 hypothetical protein AOE01nite_17960 [Acetobacter oeni]
MPDVLPIHDGIRHAQSPFTIPASPERAATQKVLSASLRRVEALSSLIAKAGTILTEGRCDETAEIDLSLAVGAVTRAMRCEAGTMPPCGRKAG